MAVSGAEVSGSTWATWAFSARSGKTKHLDPLVRTLGKNAGASG